MISKLLDLIAPKAKAQRIIKRSSGCLDTCKIRHFLSSEFKVKSKTSDGMKVRVKGHFFQT